MRKLDDSMIREFYKMNMVCAQKGYTVSERQVYAVPRDHYVVITTLGMLVAWPYELVDSESVELQRLYKITEASPIKKLKNIKRTKWTFLFVDDKNNFFDCEEQDPEKDHCVYKASSGQQFYYAPPAIQLVEKIWPPITMGGKVVETMSKQLYIKFGTSPLHGYLVFYEGGRKRGLLVNSIVE